MDLLGDRVGVGNRQGRCNSDVQLSSKAVADPASACVSHLTDSMHMKGGVGQLVQDLGFHPIEHADKHGFRRLPDDAQDHQGDREAHNRISQRKSCPYAERTRENRETRQAIDAGVIAVRDESGTADLAPDVDPQYRDRLVPQKAEDGGRRKRPEVEHRPRMQEAVDCLIPGDQGADKDNEDDYRPCEVFYSAQPEWVAFRRSAPSQLKGDPQWNSGRRVTKIVDRICEKGNTSREDYDNDLEQCCDKQTEEGPLDGPDATAGGHNGRVNDTMAMAMVTVTMLARIRLQWAIPLGGLFSSIITLSRRPCQSLRRF